MTRIRDCTSDNVFVLAEEQKLLLMILNVWFFNKCLLIKTPHSTSLLDKCVFFLQKKTSRCIITSRECTITCYAFVWEHFLLFFFLQYNELVDKVTTSETKVSEMETAVEDLQWDIEKLRKREQKLNKHLAEALEQVS